MFLLLACPSVLMYAGDKRDTTFDVRTAVIVRFGGELL